MLFTSIPPALSLTHDRPDSSNSILGSSIFDLPTAAYVHIPFCRRRCYYCDFPISVVGDRPPLTRRHPERVQQFGTIEQYVDILCQEILTSPVLPQPLETVFFGGGTPSLLLAQQLERILQAIETRIGIAAHAEISIEMDPGTFDFARLYSYKTAGINRVSLGAQAFQAELLVACGRTHTPDDIRVAVEMLNQAYLTNFSLDLISGLPHQTLELWQASLDAAIRLHPTHISVYDLTIEPGTAFDRWYQPGSQPLPSDDTAADMYRLAQRILTQAGYVHYEISNYARSGYSCRHNRVYWENRPYYGFGMGATSYVHGQRLSRPRKRQDYYQWVRQGQKEQIPEVPALEQLLDTLMLGLRLADGIAVEVISQRFGRSVLQQVLSCLFPYVQQGWVQLLDAKGEAVDWSEAADTPAMSAISRFRLSDPEGFLFSNVVLTALFKKFE